jgi:hypothetical protein
MNEFERRFHQPTVPDPATDTELQGVTRALHIALESIRLSRRALRVTRISDDQVRAQRALDDAQKVLERALPERP